MNQNSVCFTKHYNYMHIGYRVFPEGKVRPGLDAENYRAVQYFKIGRKCIT